MKEIVPCVILLDLVRVVPISTTLVKLYDNTNSLVGEFEVGTNMTMGAFGGSADSI